MMFHRSLSVRVVTVLLGFAVLAAACGDDDGDTVTSTGADDPAGQTSAADSDIAEEAADSGVAEEPADRGVGENPAADDSAAEAPQDPAAAGVEAETSGVDEGDEPSVTEAPEGAGEANEDPVVADFAAEEQAAAEAWAIVFDSATTYEQKAPHLEDAEGLQETIAAYADTGSTMGGIALAPTAVTVNGATAEITYDVRFGGNAAYEDQTGELSLDGDTWVVSRVEFCSFMASARTACPA